jgi:hypothetical protein
LKDADGWEGTQALVYNTGFQAEFHDTGLPDFSWSMIPKLENIYQMSTKSAKCS